MNRVVFMGHGTSIYSLEKIGAFSYHMFIKINKDNLNINKDDVIGDM